ncbi:hypothetical protein B0T17DRAFT_502722 [Bombardia bombarda]|uniref:Uncharacterized protein n=1 Tax=Bombardia bombarda TaxID=252184 RepID=A0AA39XJF5_9PEZI|nr:hypothetical protein B0T17DRAFT_502722 [Bombardia bombarda]
MSGRRRQNSAVSSGSRGLRQPAGQAIQAKSPHVADPFLQEFLNPSFDAAAYLNAILPPLQPSSSSSSSSSRSSQNAVPLADLSIQAQSVLSKLNAHTTRLTTTLTQLTDDILRSGSRLAYEVELLRGETLSLAESLSEGLHDDIANPTTTTPRNPENPPPSTTTTTTTTPAPAPNEPPYITQLRTLTLVRARLDSVIKTFGDAMEFVFPPSEISVSSSFLSVSAPDAGGDNHSTEEKGQQVLRALREEIVGILARNADPIRGIEQAARRIEDLKELNKVWRGTAEEKGRARFIESLARVVEDRHRDLLREIEQQQVRRDGGGRAGGGEGERKGGGGGGEGDQSSSSHAENKGGMAGMVL